MLWTNKNEFEHVKPEVMELMERKVKGIAKEMTAAQEIKAITKDLYAVYYHGTGRKVKVNDNMFMFLLGEYGERPIGYLKS